MPSIGSRYSTFVLIRLPKYVKTTCEWSRERSSQQSPVRGRWVRFEILVKILRSGVVGEAVGGTTTGPPALPCNRIMGRGRTGTIFDVMEGRGSWLRWPFQIADRGNGQQPRPPIVHFSNQKYQTLRKVALQPVYSTCFGRAGEIC